MKIKTLLISALAATALVSARADEVTIAGSTSGSFSNPNASLTFEDGNFTSVTVGGFGTVGDQAGQDNNFGTMSFTTTGKQKFGGTFDLVITFTAPAGITGGQDATYTATVTGAVNKNGAGGALIDFSGAGSQTFAFTSGDTSGNFTLTLNTVALNVNGTGETASIALSGFFTGSQTTVGVPDGGATVALLGLGLVGVAALRRKLATA